MRETTPTLAKFAHIAAGYREQIEAGALRPGDRLPSFAEVRAQLGVGQSTLERAHELLERENLIVREPGRGIFVAQPRRRARTGIIGILGIDAAKGHHPYFSRLLEGVHRIAHAAGAEILLLNENIPFTAGKVDGVLLYSSAPDLALRKLPPEVPCVSILTAARGVYSVTVDDGEGIRLAVRHLMDQGHQRLAYLTASSVNRTVTCGRIQAFEAALAEGGITPRPEWIRPLPEARVVHHTEIYRAFVGWGQEAMVSWLESDWRSLGCTAILAHNDDTAIGAARALTAAGYSVPRDVSLVGYDDTLSAELNFPPLSTVHVPLREIGERALQLLLQEIEGESSESPTPHNTVFSPTFQMRASTSAPPQG